MTIDEANETIAKKTCKLEGDADQSSQAHFDKALHYDAMAKRADSEQKRVMANKALDKHLNVAAALETLGK